MTNLNFILGPNIYSGQLNDIITNNSYAHNVYARDTDYSTIDLADNSYVIIRAHGGRLFFKHFIELGYNSTNFFSINYYFPSFTGSLLKQISKNKIINVELISCHGGAAIYDIASLSKWSSLMTFTSSNQESILSLGHEILTRSIDFSHSENPFIKYVSYIYTNPDSSSFAINTKDKNFFVSSIYSLVDSFAMIYSYFLDIIGIPQFAVYPNQDNVIFVSSINSLKDFSILGIIKWQNAQLDKFLEFSSSIQNKMNNQRSDQIDELLELFRNQQDKSEWHNNFNITRYQELLFINMAYRGELDNIKNILSFKEVNTNSLLEDSRSALHIAAHNGHLKVVRELIKVGALVDEKDIFFESPLQMAKSKGHLEVVRELKNAGASDSYIRGMPYQFGVAILKLEDLLEMVEPEISSSNKTSDSDDGSIPANMCTAYSTYLIGDTCPFHE